MITPAYRASKFPSLRAWVWHLPSRAVSASINWSAGFQSGVQLHTCTGWQQPFYRQVVAQLDLLKHRSKHVAFLWNYHLLRVRKITIWMGIHCGYPSGIIRSVSYSPFSAHNWKHVRNCIGRSAGNHNHRQNSVSRGCLWRVRMTHKAKKYWCFLSHKLWTCH